MTSRERLDRVRTVLAAAVQVRPEDRPGFLDSQCADDSALLAEVEALLDLHQSAERFMSQSLPELLGTADSKLRGNLAAGTLLKNRYRIERKISETSFATVYLAADELIGQKWVVVKSLDHVMDETTLHELCDSELQALSRIQHPNVVGIFDLGTLDNGMPFLVLEYVPGLTLRELLRAGPIPARKARMILQEIGRALAAAHKVSVWHLDLKPENVIVSDESAGDLRATLIDFGIARLKSSPGGTFLAGSPNYMAPEQDDRPSAQCDIYAFALVAFELFTGHLPRQGRSIKSQLPSSLGAKLRTAIVRGLELDPAARFEDVSELVAAIGTEPARPMLTAYAAMLAVTAVIATAVYLSPGLAPLQYAKPVPLVSTIGIDHQMALTPDGNEVYYAKGEVGLRDIYKKSVNGGDPVLVVGGFGDDAQPQVAPDGKSLAFIRRGARLEIVQKSLVDGAEVVLIGGIDVDRYSWASNGSRIVFSGLAEHGMQRLRVLEAESRTTLALEISGVPDCGLFHPSVSPDGRALAFSCRWAQGSDDLFVVALSRDLKADGKARRVTSRKDRIQSVAWSPDSKTVLYVSGPLGNGFLWRVDPMRSVEPIRVAAVQGPIESVAVARNAWRMAFGEYISTTDLWQYRPGADLPPRLLVSSGRGDEEGLVSPDGRRLLFGSARSGSAQVWVADADGGNPQQLTKFEGADIVAGIWTADSNEALISVRSKDVGERIYRSPIREPRGLTRVLDGAMATAVSRDGKWLYVTKSAGARRSIWRTQLVGARSTELVADGGAFGVESADGKGFYFARKNESEGVWYQPLGGGAATQMVDRLYQRNLFAVGKTGIYYMAATQGEAYPSLFFKSFQRDGSPRILLAFERPIGWGLSLAPDEQSLVFSQVDVGNSSIMLIKRFR